MFNAFVLIVIVTFVLITCRTYYQRWRNDRSRVDPGSGARSGPRRAEDDSHPDIGPHRGGPPNSGGGGFGP
ncbi:MAG: hypothetical protein ACJ74U_00520 [Jatrophihabitantaceae bacterium]